MRFIKNFKEIYKYSKGSRYYILLYIFASSITVGLSVLMPILSAQVLVNYTEGIWGKVISIALTLVILDIAATIFRLMHQFASEKFTKIVVTKIQLEMGKELLKIKLKDIDTTSNGVFVQRITRDANETANIITDLIFYGTSILGSLGALIVIFSINYKLGLLYILFIIINLAYEKYRIHIIDKKDLSFRNQREKTSGFATEVVRGIRDVKMLNAEEPFIDKVNSEIADLNNKNYEIFSTRRFMYSISTIFSILFEFVIICIIVYFAKSNVITIAKGLVVYNYRYEVNSFIFGIRELFDSIREFNMASDRVYSLLGNTEFEKETFGSVHIDNIEGSFEFKNVSFSYDKNKVLDDLSFKVNPNETVAFVGKSGVGKTTIFNLICKFYEVDKGIIKIDNINIKDLDKESIRGNITIINQDPYIFNMTIKDNFKLFKKNITDKEIIKYCKIAEIHEFINNLPDKYDTLLGENGINLSGGQKQRLAIARALIQNTKIILFDEATSALDNETQNKIQEAISNMKGKHTILIIAHRLSTIINSDRIIFVENGKVLAEGTHKELLKKSKSYKELYETEIIK